MCGGKQHMLKVQNMLHCVSSQRISCVQLTAEEARQLHEEINPSWQIAGKR